MAHMKISVSSYMIKLDFLTLTPVEKWFLCTYFIDCLKWLFDKSGCLRSVKDSSRLEVQLH